MIYTILANYVIILAYLLLVLPPVQTIILI
jgi:hypothetical protein